MLYSRRVGTRSAVLAVGLALGGECVVLAQNVPLSTGSGSGTGAGAGAMSSANTGAGGAMSGANTGAGGAMSGRGYGSPMESGRALPLGPRMGNTPFGPGVDVSFPTDPFLVPFLLPIEADNPREPGEPTQITPGFLKQAREISDSAERSLALRQIANGAIAGSQLFLAHRILEESIRATSSVTVPLVRDQRLIGLVVSHNNLADALLRVGRENQGRLATAEEALEAGLSPLPDYPEAAVLIRMARLEWRRAVYLAMLIDNPTYRNEMLYRIAENEAIGSTTIALDFPIEMAMESLGNRLPPPAPRPAAREDANQPAAAPQPDVPGQPNPIRPEPLGERPPANLANEAVKESRPSLKKGEVDFAEVADEVLVDSWNVASKIDRLIWKHRAEVRIALSASDSRQFGRGVKLAKTIENAESRSEALLLLAEAMCRPGQSKPAAATMAYQAAAEAVASIPRAGLRGVMTGFLVDSLIASGRFEDARACSAIYPEESERFVALGAIAEQQGRRGLADSARQWIATEAPEAYRAALYRRVSTGVLSAIENRRTNEATFGGPGR